MFEIFLSIVLLVLLVTLWLFPSILCWIDNVKGTTYSCEIFGWHNGSLKSKTGKVFDGASNLARCSKCGKEVMQDSQGNWF